MSYHTVSTLLAKYPLFKAVVFSPSPPPLQKKKEKKVVPGLFLAASFHLGGSICLFQNERVRPDKSLN